MNLLIPVVLIGIPIAIALWAQWRVHHAYDKWSKVGSRGRIRGVEAAQAVMRAAGIDDVEVVEVAGKLTDHYDPTRKRLALSRDNYHGHSLAALGVAAHEAGHAIQHKVGYAPLKARMSVIPMTNIASQVLPIAILGGFFLHIGPLIYLGIACYFILTIFQLITLPVEFDASRRASAQLDGLGIIERDELPGVRQTLNAAGWTYVAAFITSLGWLLYLLLARR